METTRALAKMDSINKHCNKNTHPYSDLVEQEYGPMNDTNTVNTAMCEDQLLASPALPKSDATKHQNRNSEKMQSTMLHRQPKSMFADKLEPLRVRERQLSHQEVEDLRENVRGMNHETDELWADAILISDDNAMLIRDLEDVQSRNKVLEQENKYLRNQLDDALLRMEQQNVSLYSSKGGGLVDAWGATDYEVVIEALRKNTNRKVRAVNREKEQLEKLMRHHEEEAEIATNIARAAIEKSRGLQNILKRCASCSVKNTNESVEHEKGNKGRRNSSCTDPCIKKTAGDNTNEGTRAPHRLSSTFSQLLPKTNIRHSSFCQELLQANEDPTEPTGSEFVLGQRHENARAHSGSRKLNEEQGDCYIPSKNIPAAHNRRASDPLDRHRGGLGRSLHCRMWGGSKRQGSLTAVGGASSQPLFKGNVHRTSRRMKDNVRVGEDRREHISDDAAQQGEGGQNEQHVKKYSKSGCNDSEGPKVTCHSGARMGTEKCVVLGDTGVVIASGQNSENHPAGGIVVGGGSFVELKDIDELTVDSYHDAGSNESQQRRRMSVSTVFLRLWVWQGAKSPARVLDDSSKTKGITTSLHH
jgi:hypothetical protein